MASPSFRDGPAAKWPAAKNGPVSSGGSRAYGLYGLPGKGLHEFTAIRPSAKGLDWLPLKVFSSDETASTFLEKLIEPVEFIILRSGRLSALARATRCARRLTRVNGMANY